jgi:acetylornithine/N-succinyldiaminopimelate aminotransferase
MSAISKPESPIFDTFAPAPLAFEHGDGVRLYTDDGREFLDFGAGIAVSSLGHSHPHLVAALSEQASKLWHVSNLYEIPGQKRLAARLCAATFADKVFFTNSGAEALECCFKTARRHHFGAGNPERVDILTFEGAFHGRTLATIAAGGQEKYLEGFGPKAPGFIQLPFGDEDAVKEAVGETTAAIIIEPVQGEGGIRPASGTFLRFLRQICDENDILLIYDEVQTGVGRTGKFFAYEWSGAAPDLMAVAKGIGGGFPLGACLATKEAASAMQIGTHGTTYGGNPLAMAVGNAVLDVVLEEGFLEDVSEIALYLRQQLAELSDGFPDLIEEVRGEGLLLGLKCKIPNGDVVTAFRDAGLLSIPAGDNVVRLIPPLIITIDDVREAKEKMQRALAAISGKTEDEA